MSVSPIERPVSALRQRMLEDMAMRGLRSDTQRDYIRLARLSQLAPKNP
jgi:integrase/recombinase XerD